MPKAVHILLGLLAHYYETGCLDSLHWCSQADLSDRHGQSICAEATSLCRKMVEGPYERLSGRSAYDIRANKSATLPPEDWIHYLNTAFVQNALGVDLNYTTSQSLQVMTGFYYTGDHSYPQTLKDLEVLLDHGVRVALVYGDAVSSLPKTKTKNSELMTVPERIIFVTGLGVRPSHSS